MCMAFICGSSSSGSSSSSSSSSRPSCCWQCCMLVGLLRCSLLTVRCDASRTSVSEERFSWTVGWRTRSRMGWWDCWGSTASRRCRRAETTHSRWSQDRTRWWVTGHATGSSRGRKLRGWWWWCEEPFSHGSRSCCPPAPTSPSPGVADGRRLPRSSLHDAARRRLSSSRGPTGVEPTTCHLRPGDVCCRVAAATAPASGSGSSRHLRRALPCRRGTEVGPARSTEVGPARSIEAGPAGRGTQVGSARSTEVGPARSFHAERQQQCSQSQLGLAFPLQSERRCRLPVLSPRRQIPPNRSCQLSETGSRCCRRRFGADRRHNGSPRPAAVAPRRATQNDVQSRLACRSRRIGVESSWSWRNDVDRCSQLDWGMWKGFFPPGWRCCLQCLESRQTTQQRTRTQSVHRCWWSPWPGCCVLWRHPPVDYIHQAKNLVQPLLDNLRCSSLLWLQNIQLFRIFTARQFLLTRDICLSVCSSVCWRAIKTNEMLKSFKSK